MSSTALELFVPEKNGHISDLPFTMDKNSVQQWVTHLPLANTGETVKQLFQALVSLNRCQLAPTDIIRTLELLHSPIDYVMKALHKHFVSAPHPLNPRGKRVSDLTIEINKELAIGYKHIIKGATSIGASSPGNTILLVGLQRALLYLNRVLITHYQSYTLPGSHIWKEVHQIYLYAENNNLHRTDIENSIGEEINNITTISDTYKKILLLSIANPYRLDGDKINKLDMALDSYAMLASLNDEVDPNTSAGQFIIEPDSDSKPIPFALYKKEILKGSQIICTEKMTSLLKKELKNSTIESNHGLSKGLFKSLIPAWEHSNKRKNLRTKKQNNTEVAVGLTASHRKMEETTSVGDSALLESDETTVLYGTNEKQNSQFNIQSCTIANRSSKGYGLIWNGEKTQLIRVGELVAVKDTVKKQGQQDTVWNICLVRWIQHSNAETFHFGAELLSKDAQSVKAKNFDKNNANNTSAKLECLLIPADTALNIPPSIITPGLFRMEQRLFIEMASEQHIIALTRLIRSKTSFKQFSYAIVDEEGNFSEHTHPEEAKKQEKKPVAKKDDPFGNIWSSI